MITGTPKEITCKTRPETLPRGVNRKPRSKQFAYRCFFWNLWEIVGSEWLMSRSKTGTASQIRAIANQRKETSLVTTDKTSHASIRSNPTNLLDTSGPTKRMSSLSRPKPKLRFVLPATHQSRIVQDIKSTGSMQNESR